MGNTEIPPDDGYTWRKYGQKEILGSKFPRSYYRCTHKSFYGCNAKKQVQRLDDDPNTFQVTYYGVHTCHMSSTAPSSGSGGPPSITTTRPPSTSTSEVLQIQSSSTQPPTNYSSSSSSIPIPLSRWIFMGFEATPIPSRRNTTMAIGDGGGGGGAATRDGKETVECPVMDLADAMFNSGSSTSNNSMDSIFPSMHE
ncbi:PREDICTED: probable WRKY transcription factor 41 [Nelumbo nucifera]|nr:PREDICTED: probable WRKY transcription factor 41 [Nelumbo nucifera]